MNEEKASCCCSGEKKLVEPTLRLIGGFFICLSVVLGMLHNPNWYFFTLFVGLNLFQSGITNWCPMVWFLEKLGYKRTC